MERESFADPALAEVMNRDFVCIKVDREERPDLDEIYMAATQVLAEQGGWPNSVFLTPRLEPFFAGTYFPPADRHGRPGFATVLRSLAHAWKERRPEVEEQAHEVAAAMRGYLEGNFAPAAAPPGREAAERSLAGLRQRFDPTWGGFGEAPKFPTPANLYLLLELAGERFEAGAMLAATLDQMARGGLFDQLGGGFHRYATDREWRVPHFEKMLYDNGLLLEVYARDAARSGDPERARIVRRTAEFLEREMSAPEGAFWCAIDAETAGQEGAFYVWSAAELGEVLGPEDFAFLAPILGFDGEPFFEHQQYVLHLRRPIDVLARERRMTPEALWREIAPLEERLLARRATRARPATDDKLLADWNGMAIAGFATAGRLLGEPAWIERAARAAEFVLTAMWPPGGPLRHSFRGRLGRAPAFLSDYAFLVRGLLALHEATGAPRWLAAARDLHAEQGARLGSRTGAYFDAVQTPDLLVRPRSAFDGAIPGANGIAAWNAVELCRRGEGPELAAEAAGILRAFGEVMARQPDGTRTLAIAARRLAELESAAAGEPAAPGRPWEVEALAAVTAEVRVHAPGADGWIPFDLLLAVSDGWHLAAGEDGPEGLRLDGDGAELRQLAFPTAQLFRPSAAAEGVLAYFGRLAVHGVFRATHPRPRLVVRYQACDATRCLAPVERRLDLG